MFDSWFYLVAEGNLVDLFILSFALASFVELFSLDSGISSTSGWSRSGWLGAGLSSGNV